MGGIAGIVFGGQDCGQVAKNMACMMSYRAPDGKSEADGEGIHLIGLYRRPHMEYPEAVPLLKVAPSTLVVSDSRIDNRDELLRHLGLGDVSDNELICAALAEWDVSFPEKLIGDFAFVIFQEDRNRLLIGRDSAGLKPLFYSWTEAGLIISSEIAPIVHCFPSDRYNETHIRDFLLGGSTQSEEMITAGVFRVPPGHILELTSDRSIRRSRYWDPSTIEVSDGGSADELWALLRDSVRQRSKNTGPVGFACSGGLDSSSICYAAARCGLESILPLRTFSIVFDATPAESERRFIETAVNDLNADASFIDMSGYDPLDDLSDHIVEQGRLFHAPGLVMNGKFYEYISAKGCSVLIDGHGGDEIISHGFPRLDQLAAAGEWAELWRCTAAPATTFGTSRLKLIVSYWLRYGTRRQWRIRKALLLLLWRETNTSNILGPSLKETTPQPKLHPKHGAPTAENAAHIESIFSPMMLDSLEVIELAAARRGIEIRFPFFDRRIIEFALSLPESAKLDGRWTRAILRAAIKDIVPESLRLRTAKYDFSKQVARGILSSKDRTLEDALQDNKIKNLVNRSMIRLAWKRLSLSGESAATTDVFMAWRTVALAKWIKATRKVSTIDDL